MRRSLSWLLVFTPAVALGAPVVPLTWSPDGRWVAYTVGPASNPSPSPAGWIFDTGAGGRGPATARKAGPPADPPNFRIYAADAQSGASVLLQESGGPLTSAAWSPDGRSIAFGRIVAGGPGPRRFEVVIQNAPGQNRVVLSQPLVERDEGAFPWASIAPAWSPDGHYLTVPDFSIPMGLSVVQVDDGRVLKTMEGASPSWSPDGTRLAFIGAGRTSPLLVVEVSPGRVEKASSVGEVELKFGPPRHQVNLGQTYQSPFWSRDGRSLMAVARRLVVRGRGPSLQIDLLRVRVDSGSVETVAHLTSDPIEQDKPFRGITLAYDRDVDNVFYAFDVDSEPASIVWYRPRNQETVDHFHPVAPAVRVDSLAFSTDGKTLAIRFGETGGGSTVALYDVSTKRVTLLASDDPPRREWISLLVSTARRLLKASLPAPVVGGRALERPTILPAPGELPANQQEVGLQLQKLGRLGRPLCQSDSGDEEGETAGGRSLNEARLFFDALREDYPAALASLEALEARTSSTDSRERLLALRAQFFVGMGDPEKAARTIEFLKTIEGAADLRVEETPAGTVLTPQQRKSSSGWADYLARLLKEPTAAGPGGLGGDEPPIVPINPGARVPGVRGIPFDRLPNGVFVVPQDGPGPADNPGGPAVRPRFVRPRPVPPPPARFPVPF